MPEIQLVDVCKSFRAPDGLAIAALRGLSLAVAAEELLALVGPSGSGKTSALRMIAGLDSPDSGTIRIGGRDMAGVPPHERGVAMVFQDHPLFPHLSVRENLGFSLRLRKRPRAEIEQSVAEVSQRLGIESLLDRPPRGLSGGERQRVALGMALVRRPEVLLLDEPLAQVDPLRRAELRGEIRRIQREFRLTTIHVTHDRAEAFEMADRIAVVRAGEVQQVGRPEELRSSPANAFVAAFLGLPA